jgi:hypothetical protein
MPSTKQASDPDFPPFEFKTKQASPAFPDANQLRDGINIRAVTGGYRCRGGQTKAASNAATASLDGIWEAGDVAAPTVI